MQNPSAFIDVKELYNGMMLNNAIGISLEGKWKGWLFAKHPDGHWVTIAKVPEISQENKEVKPSASDNKTDGAEPEEIISLCIGCIKESCLHRSEIKSNPVKICAMRQVK
jgi:hypothetical protein